MIDFLIVGGGFSGIAVARGLEKRYKSFHLFDPATLNSATAVSGGLINPVSGRKSKLQWNIEQLLPLIKDHYADLEKLLDCKLISACNILKIHKSETALEDWQNVEQVPQLQNFIEPNFDIHKFNRFLDFRFGAVTIKNALRIDTLMLIEKYQHYLGDRFKKEKFVYSEMQMQGSNFNYNDEMYHTVIFCEGVAAMENPWFKNIPFKPAKGECLIIEIPNFSTSLIIHRGIILIPLGECRYWVGATNSWDDLSTATTGAGLQELKNGLDQLLKLPYTILEHKASIRPTIRDRSPVVGRHPDHQNMYLLNGMGTKGASLSNFYAEILLQHILTRSEIPAEANIKRFYDLLRE